MSNNANTEQQPNSGFFKVFLQSKTKYLYAPFPFDAKNRFYYIHEPVPLLYSVSRTFASSLLEFLEQPVLDYKGTDDKLFRKLYLETKDGQFVRMKNWIHEMEQSLDPKLEQVQIDISTATKVRPYRFVSTFAKHLEAGRSKANSTSTTTTTSNFLDDMSLGSLNSESEDSDDDDSDEEQNANFWKQKYKLTKRMLKTTEEMLELERARKKRKLE